MKLRQSSFHVAIVLTLLPIASLHVCPNLCVLRLFFDRKHFYTSKARFELSNYSAVIPVSKPTCPIESTSAEARQLFNGECECAVSCHLSLKPFRSLARCRHSQSGLRASVFLLSIGFVFCSCQRYDSQVEALGKQYVQRHVGLGCACQTNCRLWSSCHCCWCYRTSCSWQRDGILWISSCGNFEGLNCSTYDGGGRGHVEGWQLVLVLAVSKHRWLGCSICTGTLHGWNGCCWCVCVFKKKGNVPKCDIILQKVSRMINFQATTQMHLSHKHGSLQL